MKLQVQEAANVPRGEGTKGKHAFVMLDNRQLSLDTPACSSAS